MDHVLTNYVTRLVSTKYTDDHLKTLASKLPTPSITITNNKNSKITVAGGNLTLQTKRKTRKRKQDVKKNKNTYNFIELVTNGIDYNINSPEIDTQHKAKIEELAYIKLNNSDICDNQLVLNEYNKNMKQQVDLDRINEHPRLLDFLREAMSQELDVLFFWLNTYSFDENLTTEEINNLIFGKLVLMGYYANCVSPRAPTGLNERTPFVEYVVPVLKYFSAAYKNLAFQWCEKGLDTNSYITLYQLESGSKRLVDGIGYDVHTDYEVMLVESSGDKSEDHAKEDTLKLLECSIRSLKAEMEKNKFSKLDTFKERRFFTCLYAKDKLTMLQTFLVDSKRWGYTFVREVIIPRSWADRYNWLKVFELIFCLKNHLDEQAKIMDRLTKESSGWIPVEEGAAIKDLVNEASS